MSKKWRIAQGKFKSLMEVVLKFTNVKEVAYSPRAMLVLKATLAGIFLLVLAGFYILFMSALISRFMKCGYSDCAQRFLKVLLVYVLFLLISIPAVMSAYRSILRVFQKQEAPVLKNVNVKRRVTMREVFQEAREHIFPIMPWRVRAAFITIFALSAYILIVSVLSLKRDIPAALASICLLAFFLIFLFSCFKKIVIEIILKREKPDGLGHRKTLHEIRKEEQ